MKRKAEEYDKMSKDYEESLQLPLQHLSLSIASILGKPPSRIRVFLRPLSR